jgi:hypothetical protein
MFLGVKLEISLTNRIDRSGNGDKNSAQRTFTPVVVRNGPRLWFLIIL